MEAILEDLAAFAEPTSLDGDPQVLKDLNTYLNQTPYSFKIDRVLALLFPENQETGLLAYIRQRIGDKRAAKGKLQALLAIEWFLRNYKIKRLVWQYCDKIKETVDILWRKEAQEPSNIKEESVQCLAVLLKNFREHICGAEFALATLYRDLLVCTDKSDYTPSVRAKIFHCLGILSGYGRESFLKNEHAFNQLLRLFSNTLIQQVESAHHHVNVNILNGCILGLTEFFSSFIDLIHPELEYVKKIYEKVEQIIDPRCSIANDEQTPKLKRREFQRAGLHFIGRHGEIYAEQLFQQYTQWFEDIIQWVRSGNTEDSRAGRYAMDTFLEVICNHAKQRNEIDPDSCKPFMKFFTQKFSSLASSGESAKGETSIALKGLSLLCRSVCDSKSRRTLLGALFTKMRTVTVELSLPGVDKYSGSHFIMPSLLEALGTVLLEVDKPEWTEIQNDDIGKLESLCIHLITYYPDLTDKYKAMSPRALVKVVNAMCRNPHINQYGYDFANHVLSEALTLVIASPTEAEAAILVEAYLQENRQTLRPAKKPEYGRSGIQGIYGRLGIKTVKFYQPFFQALFQPALFDPLIRQSVFDGIMDWSMSCIEKFDLSIEYMVEDDEAFVQIGSSPTAGPETKANTVKDFQLFINLVDLLFDFVGNVDVELFSPWVQPWLQKTIEYSYQHPLVSGFYRIMSFVFTAARKLEYFKKSERESVDQCIKFLKSVSLRFTEFSDDLLVSALDVWLAAPSEIVISCCDQLPITLQTVFQSGKSYYPIADRGIQAIHRWFQLSNFPDSIKAEIVTSLFPLWKTYLQANETKTDTSAVNKTVAVTGAKQHVKSYYSQRRIEVIKSELQKTSMESVQHSIMRLIGTYGHFIDMTCNNSDIGFTLERKFLWYSIPLKEMKADVYLDYVVPELLNICKQTADRQSRTRASEVLYTLTLYLVGSIANRVTDVDGSTAISLYRETLSCIIDFGCDDDHVIRQLFNPLALQIVHWATKAPAIVSEITFQLILDKLVHAEAQSKRDFCSICLEEYISYSMQKDQTKDIDKVIRNLVTLGQHSASVYRQAATVGFNRVYYLSRHNARLADMYTLELLQSFIIGLSLTDDSEASGLLVQGTKRAIARIERVIIRLKESFNERTKDRRIPKGVKGGKLVNVLDWLLGKSALVNMVCRNECLRLIEVLAKHVKGFRSVNHYLANFDERNASHGLTLGCLAEQALASLTGTETKQELVLALIKVSDVYRFLNSNGYTVENLLSSSASKFHATLKSVLSWYRASCLDESQVEVDTNILAQLLYNVALFSSSAGSFTGQVIRASVELSVKLEPEVLRQSKLKDVWIHHKQICEENLEVMDFVKETWQHLINNGLLIGNISVKGLHWLSYIVNANMFNLHAGKIQTMCLNLWNYVDKMLFEETETDLTQKTLSMRERHLVDAAFQLLAVILTDENQIMKKYCSPKHVRSARSVATSLTKGDIYQMHSIVHFGTNKNLYQFEKFVSVYSMETLGKMIQRLLYAVKNNKDLRKSVGQYLVEKIITVWNQLLLNCAKPAVAKMITGMASLHKNVCQNSIKLCAWWCGPTMLEDVNLSFAAKTDYIHFFGLFGTSMDDGVAEKAISSVHAFVKGIGQPPLLKWEEEENNAMKVLYTLVTVYKQNPKKTAVLEAILSLVSCSTKLTGDKPNSCCSRARAKLIKIVETLQDRQMQLTILNTVYSFLVKNMSDSCGSLIITDFCLLPCLANLKDAALRTFFKDHVVEIMKFAGLAPTDKMAWVLKISAFSMLEAVCLLKTENQEPFLKSAELDGAYLSGISKPNPAPDHKNFARDLLSLCKSYTNPSEFDETNRQFAFKCNQAAFSTGGAAVRTLEPPFTLLLKLTVQLPPTKENRAGWNNIIQDDVEYTFPDVVNSGSSVLESDPDADSNNETDVRSIYAVSNAEQRKQNLIGSSLKIDATDYDFTTTATISNLKYYERIFGKRKSRQTLDVFVSPSDSKSSAAGLSISHHRCMLSFVNSLAKVLDMVPKDTNSSKSAEELISVLESLLRSPTANVRLFVLAAFQKIKKELKRFAAELINSIIEALLPHQNGESITGNTFNIFLKDTLLMLFEWENNVPNSGLVLRLLQFLFHLIHNDRRDLLQQNHKFVQTVVKLWVRDEENDLPMTSLRHLFEKSEDKKLPLELCKNVLLVGKLPCMITSGVDSRKRLTLKELLKFTNDSFTGRSKLAYLLAAEVVGLLLQKLNSAAHQGEVKLLVDTTSKLIEREQGSYPGAMMQIVATICKYYPPFATQFQDRAFSTVRVLEYREEALQVLTVIAKYNIDKVGAEPESERALTDWVSDFYEELSSRSVFRTPCRSEREIGAAVQLFSYFIRYLRTEEKVIPILDWTEVAERTSDANLRSAYANAALELYRNFGFDNKATASSASVLAKKLEKLFLRLLKDEDEKVKDTVTKFWDNNLVNGPNTLEFLTKLLELLEDEADAISVMVDLLLRRSTTSADFFRNIFINDLAENPQEYNIDTSWRLRHASFQPLFAESFSSMPDFTQLPTAIQHSVMSQRLGAGGVGLNMLQSTLRSSMSTLTQSQIDSQIEPSQAGGSFYQDKFYASLNSYSANEILQGQHISETTELSMDPLHSLRQKFPSRPVAQSDFYAIRAHEVQELKTQQHVEDIRIRRGDVKLTRKYKIAELPVISMTHSEFLQTLKSLAQVDSSLGRIFLSHLMCGILAEINLAGSANSKIRSSGKKHLRNFISAAETILSKGYASMEPAFASVLIDLMVTVADEIKICPSVIEVVCDCYQMQGLGILAIESALQHCGEQEERDAKRRRVDNDCETTSHLFLLAKLYRGLEEHDSLRTVFSLAAQNIPESAIVYEAARSALLYESEGKFAEAYDAYSELYCKEVERHAPDDRLQMWDSSFYKCCKMLGRWDEAFQRASDKVMELGGFEAAFEDSYYGGEVVEDHLLSSSQILVRGVSTSGTDDQEMEVDETHQSGEIKQIFAHIKSDKAMWESLLRFPEVPILSACLGDDIGQTLIILDKGVAQTLTAFKNFDSYTLYQRKELVLRLQRFEFLRNFLNLAQNIEVGHVDDVGLRGIRANLDTVLFSKWKNIGYPSNANLYGANVLVAEKSYYLATIGSELDRKVPDTDELFNLLRTLNIEQHFWLIDLGIQAGNSDVTINAFEVVKELINKASDYEPHLYALNSKYLLEFPDGEDWGPIWVRTWKKMAKTENVALGLLGKTNLLRSLCANALTGTIDERTASLICKVLSVGSTAMLQEKILQLSSQLATEIYDDRNAASESYSGKVQFSLYKLVGQVKENLLRSNSPTSLCDVDKILVESLGRSLVCGNEESAIYFPTVFSLLEANTSLLRSFEKLVQHIPSWMFLPWLDQIVVNYRSSKLLKAMLRKLISRVFQDYPSAFQLQYPDLFEELQSSNIRLITLYEKYTQCLEAIEVPNVMFRHTMRLVERCGSDQNSHRVSDTIHALKHKLEKILRNPDMYGSIHQNFGKAMLGVVESELRVINEQDPMDDYNSREDYAIAYSTAVKRILAKYNDLTKTFISGNVSLADFSPWLASFQSSDFSEVLEIPGLYSKFKKPIVEYHPSIVSFQPTVLVLTSLTRPIRLTMTCNNGKDAKFLVKKGDDLRQDKRIQQCFYVSNEIFRMDQSCKDRRLQVKTYSVIPMSNDFGLIEWVEKTLSVKDIILHDAMLKNQFGDSQQRFSTWIGSYGKKCGLRSGDPRSYHFNAKLCSKEDAEQFYDDIKHHFDEFIFKNRIMNGCNTLEEFYVLRERMIRSYATMCYAHWLLGIGDRHLENQMISTATGDFVGIDFGRSFGMAIFKQPVPELVPFRMTPQMQGFCKPYGPQGIFKETMLYVKRAMNKSGELLLTVVDVFIKEPSADWLKSRTRATSGPEVEEEQKGDILECIDILRKKLQSENPVFMIGKDVANSVYGKDVREIYAAVLENSVVFNELQNKCTDEQYVDMLIHLAQNKYLLSRMFVGWSSWI